MSCRRAYEIDLAAFLADPRNAAYADFREHYPRCAACAAEVRAWTELEGLLRAPEAHPAPEKLLALQDARAALAPVERAALEEHVAGCPSCRDELEALRGFTPHAPTEAAPAGGSALGSLLAGIRSLLVQPAFAYALVLLFAAPTLYRLVTSEDELLRDAPLERAVEKQAAQIDESLALEPEAQLAERKDEDARSAAKAKPARRPADLSDTANRVAGAARADDALAAEPSPPTAETAETAETAKIAERAESSALRKRSAEAESRAAAARPKEVDLDPIHRDQLRALGYVEAPSGPPQPSGAAPREKPRQALRAAEAPAAASTRPPAPAAESFASSPLTADAKRTADALEAEAFGDAAQARPSFEPGVQGGHRLRVPLEAGMVEVEVRVTPPGGGRMLAEHFRGAAAEVVLEIPSTWMTPGTWRIERRALGRRDVFEVTVP